MAAKKYQFDNFKKCLMNRVNASPYIVEYIENKVSSEDEAAHHTFHKVMVHNWTGSDAVLFETLSEYFTTIFIPVNSTRQGDITTFYTSNLNFILKIIKFDFMFPYQRNMFNMDILFNDKNSADCFEARTTIEDIVSSVVSLRFNDRFELNLSDLCNDPDFKEKKVHFYKLSLLSYFKILMLRMGRDTKTLNLSNNNLSQVPVDILNFFIKGDLIAINLSNNNIPSLTELLRVTSKIEKLWLEGNPLCEEMDAVTYVKTIVMKFPRLTELDGIRLNQHGIMFPFFPNYVDCPDRKTKMLTEKFLTLYFSHYDSNRKMVSNFYDLNASLTINTNFTAQQEESLYHYSQHSRNALDAARRNFVLTNTRLYKSRSAITGVLTQIPASQHDPTTFTVDVLKSDKKCYILVVDGTYKEKSNSKNVKDTVFRFRRTFVFSINYMHTKSTYYINNEIFTVTPATSEQVANSFKRPVRNVNECSLINPDREEGDAMCRIFAHMTQLRRSEVKSRLKFHNWDFKKALQEFIEDVRNNTLKADKFAVDNEDSFTDGSSSTEDEID